MKQGRSAEKEPALELMLVSTASSEITYKFQIRLTSNPNSNGVLGFENGLVIQQPHPLTHRPGRRPLLLLCMGLEALTIVAVVVIAATAVAAAFVVVASCLVAAN